MDTITAVITAILAICFCLPIIPPLAVIDPDPEFSFNAVDPPVVGICCKR